MSVYEAMTIRKEAYEDMATDFKQNGITVSGWVKGLHSGTVAARDDLTIEAAECVTL